MKIGLLSNGMYPATHFNRRPRMALSIPQILRQFKADVAKALSAETVNHICGCLGYAWRHRVFDPVTTVHVFLLQILHGNTACTALSRLAALTFSAAAYCLAHKRWPLARPPHLDLGRLQLLHARHPGLASSLRPTSLPGQRVRLPGGPPAGLVP